MSDEVAAIGHGPGEDGVCDNCGVNHKQGLLDDASSYAVLDDAAEWYREQSEKRGSDLSVLTPGMLSFTHSFTQANVARLMDSYIAEGLSPRDATYRICDFMLQFGFELSLITRDFLLSGMDAPIQIKPKEETIEKFREDVEKIYSEEFQPPQMMVISGSALREFLRDQLGLTQEQIEDAVATAPFPVSDAETGERRVEDVDPPGMYL